MYLPTVCRQGRMVSVGMSSKREHTLSMTRSASSSSSSAASSSSEVMRGPNWSFLGGGSAFLARFLGGGAAMASASAAAISLAVRAMPLLQFERSIAHQEHVLSYYVGR